MKFPHNYERLVEIHLKEIKQGHSLKEILKDANEIENIAMKWFLNLDPSERCFAVCGLLLEGELDHFFFKLYKRLIELMHLDGYKIEIKSVLQLKKNMSMYMHTSGTISYKHPSYMRAVITIYGHDFTHEHKYLFLLIEEMTLASVDFHEKIGMTDEEKEEQLTTLIFKFHSLRNLKAMCLIDADKTLLILERSYKSWFKMTDMFCIALVELYELYPEKITTMCKKFLQDTDFSSMEFEKWTRFGIRRQLKVSDILYIILTGIKRDIRTQASLLR